MQSHAIICNIWLHFLNSTSTSLPQSQKLCSLSIFGVAKINLFCTGCRSRTDNNWDQEGLAWHAPESMLWA